ncbi:MAG: GntR family transcriptional regulator [Aestuariivirga sp.]
MAKILNGRTGKMGKVEKGLLRKSAYDSLKSMIITGKLSPGSRITENELATTLKVSRTPIREALNRLERDGMVTSRPRQGFAVNEFDITMLRESFEVREVLDGHATELATARLTTTDKENLKAMLAECERLANLPKRTQEDKFQELQIGTDIHRMIAKLSGNEMLCNMLNSILDKCQHYIWLELTWLDDWKDAREEHAAIVNAMCAGDARLAGSHARKHIRESRDEILKLLQAKSDLQSFMAKAS